MKLNVYEILDKFKQAPDRASKIATLRKYRTWELEQVLKGTFHPGIKFADIKVPYYKPNDQPIGMSYNTIHGELDRIYIFIPGHPKRPAGITEKRMNQILVQILENLEAKEAVVFLGMLKRDLKVPELSYDLVKEAFPGLLP